ncbi:DUF3667 domain-containing protein [uncultured Flavobacterium sp.]|uniref:DUF3667 domain-containing protein n=1 Tax=uncultured Flavobacterium sp. TaxID=165435 RepID=UPI0030EF1296
MSCKNCQSELEENYEFCYACGGKVVTKRITIKSLVGEFMERYLSYDNKFFNTFKTLFTAPEQVINGYIEGIRGKYVDPFTYLIIALSISGFQIYLIKKGFLGFDLDKVYDAQPKEKAPFNMNVFMTNFLDYINIITILSIPLLAFLAKLTMWKNKKFNFAEHNVVLAYSYSHFTIFGTIFTLFGLISTTFFIITSSISFFIMLAYMIYVVQRVFNFNAIELIKKVFLYILFLILFYIIIIIFGIIVGILIKISYR